MMMGNLPARTTRPERDSGVALVMVLGMALVGMLLMTTLAMVTVSNSRVTADTRADMRATTSADAGIDLAMAGLSSLTHGELDNECAAAASAGAMTINGDSVEITREYVLRDPVGVVKTCPDDGDQVSQVILTSTATSPPTLFDEVEATSTVVATLAVLIPPATLEKAIFSENDFVIDNSSEISASEGSLSADADIYSNGSIDSLTPNTIEGSLIAAGGDIYFKNPTKIASDIWAAGKVVFEGSAAVEGSVFAASDATSATTDANNAVYFKNGGYVRDAVITNGGIATAAKRSPGTEGIWGAAVALDGHLTFKNDAFIGGSAYIGRSANLASGTVAGDLYAKQGVSGNGRVEGSLFTTSAPSSVSVNGTRNATLANVTFPPTISPAIDLVPGFNFPGSELPDPVRIPMPYITMNDGTGTDLSGNPTTNDIALWQAEGYVVERYTGICDSSNTRPMDQRASTIVAKNTGTKRLVFFDGCTAPVEVEQANGTFDHDVAFVSRTGFTMRNGLTLRSSKAPGDLTMHWIVPADIVQWQDVAGWPGQQKPPVCSPSSKGLLDFSGNINIKDFETLFYTPCTFQQTNAWGSNWLLGQIYAGAAGVSNSFDMRKAIVPVPSFVSGAPSPSSPAEFNLTSRFDLYGS